MSDNKHVEYRNGQAHIELSRALKTADRGEVTALAMREPTVADQLAGQESKDSDARAELNLFANLCELTPDDMKRLPLRDYFRVQAAYSGFLS